jgi:hypothetical protein
MQAGIMIVLVCAAITAMGVGIATLLASVKLEDKSFCHNCAEWLPCEDGYGICKISTTSTALTLTGCKHCCKNFSKGGREHESNTYTLPEVRRNL